MANRFRTNRLMAVVLVCLLPQCDCSAREDANPPVSQQEDSPSINIIVGHKKVATNKYTRKGVPIVPMWKASMPTEDIHHGAGFIPARRAQHANVWVPKSSEEGAYNHYACLIHYHGKLFAMWGNHTLGEDAPGQRVLFSRSDKWKDWTQPEELFPAPGPIKPRSEEGIHLKPDRWAIVDDTLYAITYVHGAGRYPIARSVGDDGELGTPFLFFPPKEFHELPEFMQMKRDALRISSEAEQINEWYERNSLVPWWASKRWGVDRRGVDGATLIECFSYRAKDGTQVLMMRNWGTPSNPVHNNRMYVSFKEKEKTWGPLHPTDIPDSPSRAQAITLDDGTVLLIGNQNVPFFDEALYLNRDPLTVSVSDDGFTFDKVFALRFGCPVKFNYPKVRGKNPGFAYPSSIVFEDYLYSLYSVGKENMAITRVPLSSLGL